MPICNNYKLLYNYSLNKCVIKVMGCQGHPDIDDQTIILVCVTNL